MNEWAGLTRTRKEDGNDAGRGGGPGPKRAGRMGDGFLQKDFMPKGSFAIVLPRIWGEIYPWKMKRGKSPKKARPEDWSKRQSGLPLKPMPDRRTKAASRISYIRSGLCCTA